MNTIWNPHSGRSYRRPETALRTAIVNQFVSYGVLHKPEGQRELRDYLASAFDMAYTSRADLRSASDANELEALFAKLAEIKDEHLAQNDALMACAVYGLRNLGAEESAGSPFGFKTWWFTNESRVLNAAESLMERHEGTQFTMRPAFLLNFLALAPSAARVRQTYRDLFPSVLGLRLARRIPQTAIHGLMEQVREAEGYEEGRRSAVIRSLSDKLKSDRQKLYGEELGQVVVPEAPT